MFKVYQIILTEEDRAIFNKRGWTGTAKIKAYADRTFADTFNPSDFRYYTHVANVMADSKEDVFYLMNMWSDPSRVEKITDCCSMSVGDIIEDEAGNRFRCASFGFDAI